MCFWMSSEIIRQKKLSALRVYFIAEIKAMDFTQTWIEKKN